MAMKKEEAFNNQLAEERKRIQEETEQAIRKNISSDFETNFASLNKTTKKMKRN